MQGWLFKSASCNFNLVQLAAESGDGAPKSAPTRGCGASLCQGWGSRQQHPGPWASRGWPRGCGKGKLLVLLARC